MYPFQVLIEINHLEAVTLNNLHRATDNQCYLNFHLVMLKTFPQISKSSRSSTTGIGDENSL